MGKELVGFFSGRVEGDRVVDFVFHCEGHFFVATVYGGAGGVDQVLDAGGSVVVGVTACFEDVVEADEVALDVDVRVVDRVADAGLRREVYDDVRLVGVKGGVEQCFVSDAASDKNMPDRGFDRVDQAEPVLFELRVVVIVHVVEADHSPAREFAAEAHDEVGADEAGGAGDQDGFAVEADGGFAHVLISPEYVARVDLIRDVVERGIVAVRDDAAAHALELLEVVDDLGAKERRPVLKRRLVDDDRRAFRLDALHDALDRRLPEVVAVALHGETVNADDDVLLAALFCRRIGLAVAVCPRDLEHAARDEVLARTVGLYDRLNEVLRHVPVVREQLLGVFGQAVSAVAKRRIIVVITYTRIEADAFDDLGGVQVFDLGVGVELVEVADAQREIGVDEQLRGFRFGAAHEEDVDVLLVSALLQERGEVVRLLARPLGGFVVANDDAARVQVVVQGLRLAQELRAEQDVVRMEFLSDVPGVANRDCRFDDDGGLFLRRFIHRGFEDKANNRLYCRTVKEVLLRIVIGRRCDNDEIGVFISSCTIRSCLEMKSARSFSGFPQKLLNVFILDGGLVVVEFLHLFWDDVDCCYVVVLRKQDSQGEADVAGSGDSNLVR